MDSTNIEVSESTVDAGGLGDFDFARLEHTVKSCDPFSILTYSKLIRLDNI